jgi:hypothetical protein
MNRIIAPATLLALLFTTGAAHAGPVKPTYFLVTEKPGITDHGDSFVVPVDDPDQIQHARDLIEAGPETAGESILIARIAAGFDGINRDLLSPTRHAWDWHVTEVEHFADISAEILDGWPGFVQDHTSSWIDQTNGRIGFWSYTITRELPNYPSQLPPVAAPLPAAAVAALVVLLPLVGLALCSRRFRH